MQIAKSWRKQPANLRLEGTRCRKCGRFDIPSVLRCPGCGCTELENYRFKGKGKVVALTTVYEAPRGFVKHVPYPAALVELEEGITVAAMLADIDNENARVGMEVVMVTRRIAAQGEDGPIVYAYKFAPPLEKQL